MRLPIALLATLISHTALAESLADKEQWTKAEAKISGYAKAPEKACGKAIVFEVKHGDFSAEEASKASDFMSAATEAFETICLNVAGAKDAVKKIKTVTMGKGTKTAFKLDGAKLLYTSDLAGGTAGPRDALVTFLKKNL